MTDASDPRDLHTLFEARFNAGDIDGLVALYEEHALLVPGPGASVHGKAAIREALQGFLALQPTIHLNTRTVLQKDNLALLQAHWTMSGAGPDGGEVHLEGNTREVAERQADGRWLYIIDDPGTGA